MSPELKYAAVLVLIGLSLLAAVLNFIAIISGEGNWLNVVFVILNSAAAVYFARQIR